MEGDSIAALDAFLDRVKARDPMQPEIHQACVRYGAREDWINYVDGANVAGFVKVADAMLAQGVV